MIEFTVWRRRRAGSSPYPRCKMGITVCLFHRTSPAQPGARRNGHETYRQPHREKVLRVHLAEVRHAPSAQRSYVSRAAVVAHQPRCGQECFDVRTSAESEPHRSRARLERELEAEE